ncbi:MAG: type II toxin-antitoxin system HicB family antitoxin [Streptococcaceae bacterium]|jgi:predicted RNase H-like HicB family nuclease|nr:type II toxin-antitoxin system HicB family antitoxin [Streptococcaceae bacterium]
MVKATYPAIFYYDDTQGIQAVYSIHFPDIPFGATQGNDIDNGLDMASDWLGIMIADYIEKGENPPIPSNINDLSPEKNNPFKDDTEFYFNYDPEKSFVTLVSVDLKDYLDNDKPVKKTLTIPKWADRLGKELQLNFSQTLTEAIAEKKMNHLPK